LRKRGYHIYFTIFFRKNKRFGQNLQKIIILVAAELSKRGKTFERFQPRAKGMPEGGNFYMLRSGARLNEQT
jgi:hypothetical protein